MIRLGTLGLEFGTMLIQVIVFIILLWLVSKYAMKPMMKVLNDRQSYIENQISAAEVSNLEAIRLVSEQKKTLEESKRAAYDMIEQARQTSSKQADTIIQEARMETTRLKEEALKEIENEKNKALASLQNQIGELSVSIASKILEKQIDADSQKGLVDGYLARVGGNK